MSTQTQNVESKMKIGKHEVDITGGLEKFDPRHIVSLRSTNRKTIEVMVLDTEKLVPLAKKVTLSIPEINQIRGVATDIRSVQLLLSKDGKKMIIAEMAGQADEQSFLCIQAVAKTMMKYGVINAFFPAHTSNEASVCFYGELDNAGSFKQIFDRAVQSLRVLEDGENLIFTTGKDIRTIHISKVGESYWEKFSKVLHSGSKEIIFIGRFQNKKVHITFSGNEVSVFKLEPHSIKKLDNVALSSGVSAFLGLIGKGVSAAVGTKKDSEESVLMLIPQSLISTAA